MRTRKIVDTADAYRDGHHERLVGRALTGLRELSPWTRDPLLDGAPPAVGECC